MGPIPPPSADENPTKPRPRALKWLDESAKTAEEKKKGLVTNNSKDDLVHKVAEDITPVDNHKDAVKSSTVKKAIKDFNLCRNKLTGLKNFTEISLDPLALPVYALPPSAN